LQGGVTYDPGNVGQAFQFNGTSTYVEVPSSPVLEFAGPFTAEAWINYDSLTSNSDGIFSKGLDADAPTDYALTVSVYSKLRPHAMIAGAWTYFDCSTTLNPHTWYHVAMVCDGSHLRCYVNGVEDGAQEVSGPVQTSEYSLGIGAYAPLSGGSGNSDFFAGRIDELSFYNRALSAAEIQSI